MATFTRDELLAIWKQARQNLTYDEVKNEIYNLERDHRLAPKLILNYKKQLEFLVQRGRAAMPKDETIEEPKGESKS